MIRLYSLYVQIGRKHYRLSNLALPKPKAVAAFQSPLIGFCHFGASLRPTINQPVYQMVFPAYGRDYTTAASATADWLAGNKDFSLTPHAGPYTSIRDYKQVIICHNKFTDLVAVG